MRSPGWPLKERNVRKLCENSVGLLRILPFGCLLSLLLLLLLLMLLREVEGGDWGMAYHRRGCIDRSRA